MTLADTYDLHIGPDELSGVPQVIRIKLVEVFYVRKHQRLRFKAIGGGPTNVPRWEKWPTMVFADASVASMLRGGQMVPVCSDLVGGARVT